MAVIQVISVFHFSICMSNINIDIEFRHYSMKEKQNWTKVKISSFMSTQHHLSLISPRLPAFDVFKGVALNLRARNCSIT